jgi:hypothetical protein
MRKHHAGRILMWTWPSTLVPGDRHENGEQFVLAWTTQGVYLLEYFRHQLSSGPEITPGLLSRPRRQRGLAPPRSFSRDLGWGRYGFNQSPGRFH